MRFQPVGQFQQGAVITRVGSLAQFAGLIAFGEPSGEPQLRDVVTDVSQGADQRQSLPGTAAVTKPGGKLPPGMIVARVSPLAQFVNVVGFGQTVCLPSLGGIVLFLDWRVGHRMTSRRTPAAVFGPAHCASGGSGAPSLSPAGATFRAVAIWPTRSRER